MTRGWGIQPSDTGMQVQGTDLTPADVFMLYEQLRTIVEKGIAERVNTVGGGHIHELVDRHGPWAWEALKP